MDNAAIITLATDIVSAHLSNNRVAADQVPGLIQSVYGALAGVGQPAVAEPAARPEPAVAIRSSIKPDSITCLECGAKQKTLKRHLSSAHGLTPAEYRERWDLKADYPMVSPAYAAIRKELAVKIGLGRKPGARRKTNGRKPAGK